MDDARMAVNAGLLALRHLQEAALGLGGSRLLAPLQADVDALARRVHGYVTALGDADPRVRDVARAELEALAATRQRTNG